MSETYLPANFDTADWEAQGECRNHDPDMFFPEEKGQARRNSVNNVVSTICAICTVSNQCLAYALSAGEVDIWGGTDGRMRDTAKRNAEAIIKFRDKAEKTTDNDSSETSSNSESTSRSTQPSGIRDERVLTLAYQKALEMRMQRYGF